MLIYKTAKLTAGNTIIKCTTAAAFCAGEAFAKLTMQFNNKKITSNFTLPANPKKTERENLGAAINAAADAMAPMVQMLLNTASPEIAGQTMTVRGMTAGDLFTGADVQQIWSQSA